MRPMICSRRVKHVWIFILAPMGGAALAAVAYNAINHSNELKEADEPKQDAAEEKAAE